MSKRARILIPILAALCAAAPGCTEPAPSVAPGMEVDLTYEAATEDGTVVDASPEDGPITFVVGKGKILPGIEDNLIGMRPGEEKTFDLENAYGVYEEGKVATMKRDAITEDTQEGDYLPMIDGGYSVIKEIRDDAVILDLNHPLAGKTITFRTVVEDVRVPATPAKG